MVFSNNYCDLVLNFKINCIVYIKGFAILICEKLINRFNIKRNNI